MKKVYVKKIHFLHEENVMKKMISTLHFLHVCFFFQKTKKKENFSFFKQMADISNILAFILQ